jgi:hypothetical protein
VRSDWWRSVAPGGNAWLTPTLSWVMPSSRRLNESTGRLITPSDSAGIGQLAVGDGLFAQGLRLGLRRANAGIVVESAPLGLDQRQFRRFHGGRDTGHR